MAPLNLFEARDLLTPAIASCNISLFYYGGFCYLMQRRYLDAARAFNHILAFIHRCGKTCGSRYAIAMLGWFMRTSLYEFAQGRYGICVAPQHRTSADTACNSDVMCFWLSSRPDTNIFIYQLAG